MFKNLQSSMWRLAVCAVLLGAVGACMPFKTPLIWDAKTGNEAVVFEGILDVVASTQSIENARTRLLITHGMCGVTPDWESSWRDHFDSTLGTSFAAAQACEHTIGKTEVTSFQSEARWGDSNVGDVVITFVNWSAHTVDAKSTLDFDDGPDGPNGRLLSRVFTSDYLKSDLVNSCLTDVIYYLGPASKELRQDVTLAVRGDLTNNPIGEGDACVATAGLANDKRMLIGESLGSKIMLDAIAKLWLATKDKQRGVLASSLSSIQSVHLLANTAPLLNVSSFSNSTAASSSDLKYGLDALTDARGSSQSLFLDKPLQVVAYSDPNDVLSHSFPTTTNISDGVKVINVAVSNARSWFGLFADPWAAHTAYPDNPCVRWTLANGSSDTDTGIATGAAKSRQCIRH